MTINTPSSEFSNSLLWYHNGTKLTSDNRINITTTGTSLTISDMVGSDAGKYEVRINSIMMQIADPVICHENILPMLENLALYSPVAFIVKESNTPTYTPEEVIVEYLLPAFEGSPDKSFLINNIFMINTAAVIDGTEMNSLLHKDGVVISDMNTYNSTVVYDKLSTQSLSITYDNSDDITGKYVHLMVGYFDTINRTACPGYSDFIIFRFPIFAFYWDIRLCG